MRLTASKSLANDSLYYENCSGLAYLNNPKCGCSTIKTSIWRHFDLMNGKTTFAGSPHQRSISPFVTDIFAHDTYDKTNFKNATLFSVVRNPYVRALSGYLEKVGGDSGV